MVKFDSDVKFNREGDFEAHVRELIATDVVPHVKGLDVLGGKKGVDLCVFRNGPSAAIFFIEVKYFNKYKNHSRVSLGNSSGEGFQPSIFRQRPDYLEANLRWLFGSAEHPDEYFLLNTSQAKTHLSCGAIGKKQNGFKKSLFSRVQGLSKDELVEEFKRWFTAA